jgi:hypothetical protein
MSVDFVGSEWRKSSRSGQGGNGNCVEVSLSPIAAGVRDSKNSFGPHLTFPATSWHAFLTAT